MFVFDLLWIKSVAFYFYLHSEFQSSPLCITISKDDITVLLWRVVSLFLFQPGIDGEMPYITTDYSFDLTGAGKLRVFKGMTRPSQVGMQWHFCSILLPFTFPHQSALAFECTELRLRWDTSYFCFKVHTLTLLEFFFWEPSPYLGTWNCMFVWCCEGA